MKKLTLLSLTILLGFQFSQAQDYHPLLEQNKYWDDVFRLSSSTCIDWAHRYFIDGDTLIDGLNYSKISYYNHYSINKEMCPPYYVDTVTFGPYYFLHEDTNARKVYYYDSQNNEPALLYDFSLQVGDTFYSPIITPAGYAVVGEIDEIELMNGELRKWWRLDGNLGYTSGMIEGLGFDSGLFEKILQFEWDSELSCAQKDGEILWSGTNWFSGCWGFVGAAEIEAAPLMIFPNPANDFIRISSPDYMGETQLQIYNSWGQLVLNTCLSTSDEVLDVSTLKPGLYIVNLQQGNLHTNRQVIIR